MQDRTLFNIGPKDLKNLGQDRVVQILRRLLWAESDRVCIGRNLNEVPDCINVGDGGIDAYIENAIPTKDEVIPRGTSGFQIKSSDLNPQSCREELHINKDLKKPLKPEIKRILNAGGTYILVLFADISRPKVVNREQAIKDELTKIDQNFKFRLYTASKLAGFINRFPSLVSWFNNYTSYCLPYDKWSENSDINIPKIYVSDEYRSKFTEEIRGKLRNSNGKCLVFRITGLAGIGKTRFVYETLGSYDIKQKVIYTKAEQFRSSPLFQALRLDESLSSIIVVDECSIQQHEELVRSFSKQGERLALITISYEIGQVPHPTLQYKIIGLSQESIKKILKAEAGGLPENILDRLSNFSDGYPRIATLLTESYLTNKTNNQNEFINISDDGLMDRLIGGNDTTSEHFRKTKKVLQWLSLFSKVGFEGELSKESEWISNTSGIDFLDFQTIVHEQRERGIIQGQHYIYVTPFMLRINLLDKWWSSHGFTNDRFEKFVISIPDEFRTDLLRRFLDQLPYITTSKKGMDFTKSILGKKGLFSDGSFLKTELGSDFFLKLTEADPDAALKCLQTTIGIWSKEELQKFGEGRRNIVWSLERIAVWKDLFRDSARLLLSLGEAENENYSNNASGVFTDLFSPGPDRVAPTAASPKERFPILQESLNSSSKEKRLLTLNACDKALEKSHFSRIAGPEYQGLRVVQLWKPKNRKEIIDYYKSVWQLVYSKLNKMLKDEQEKAISILLANARSLTYIPEMVEIIISNITKLVGKPYSNKKEILNMAESIIYHARNKLPIEVKQQWEEIRNNLIGRDFSSLMNRYVGMDLIEDKFDEDRKRVDKVGQHIDNLVKQVMSDPKLLNPELSWLVTQEAMNGHRFGYKLCQQDKDFIFLPILLDAQRKVSKNEASDYFLGGYLMALYEKNPNYWESILDELATDNNLASWVPSLTWRSGMSNRAAIRILNLAKKGVIDAAHFRIFGFGSVIKNLPEKVFKQWIEFLLQNSDDHAASIALDLYDFFYIRADIKYHLPKELTFKLLTHPSLYKKPEQQKRNQMDEYHWTEIGLKYIQLYTGKSLKLADTILKYFGEKDSILHGYKTQTHKVINYISHNYPKEIWIKVSKYLGPPIDVRAFHIKEWLRGEGLFIEEEGQLNSFSTDMVLKWVDEDIDKRAWYLATFVPKTLFRQKGKICWARELLIRYGTRKDVKNNLAANFSTEGWSGPESLHYQQKKDKLLSFRKEERNENVIRWVNSYVDDLDKRIEQAIIEEERED